MIHRAAILFLITSFLVLKGSFLYAQSDQGAEPTVDTFVKVNSPYSERFINGTSFNVILSNFGFGMGGQLERALSPVSSMYLGFQVIGLRDASEQTFQDVFGQQFIPNKYNRVISIPLVVGIKKRYFAETLSDNFRLNLHAMVGPSTAFVYPYFNDQNGDGVLDVQREQINDFLQGLDKGYLTPGAVTELGVSIDFGNDMKAISSAYLGVYAYYYFNGIQVMEPFSYSRGIRIPDSDRQYLFVSPIIRFAFGSYKKPKEVK